MRINEKGNANKICQNKKIKKNDKKSLTYNKNFGILNEQLAKRKTS